MGRRLKVHHDAASLPAPRHPDTALIPDVAEVVTDRRVRGDVVEASGHGHRAGTRQPLTESASRSALTLRIQPKLPQPVQTLPLAGTGVLRSQHDCSFALAAGGPSLFNRTVRRFLHLFLQPLLEAVQRRSTDYDHRGGSVSRNVLTDRSEEHPHESSMPAGANN
jgi:hypothetical protein